MEDKRIKITREETWERNKDKFAESFDGIRKLTSTGCMERHFITRDEQYQTERENKTRGFEYKRGNEWLEDNIQNAMVYLFSKGLRARPNDTIEEFILENRDMFGGDWVEFIERLDREV
jgi:hypothetical protein